MIYKDKNDFFSYHLIKWYEQNKRDLPWRNTDSAYFIWLSEIILQQTRVQQGLPYYYDFITQYPNIKSLAEAKEEEIMKSWQGLGYYSRARNLHYTAKHIHYNLKGKFPNTYDEIRKLKGIGDYTAAAISSFAYNLPYAVLDGNVFRILSRFFGIEEPIDTGKGKKTFQKAADILLDQKNPATHNQAIMEFAALQCVPKNPNCQECPLQEKCYAYQFDMINQLPIKSKKIKQRDRFFNYFILDNNGQTIIKQRTQNDIWKKLYDFPLIETDKAISFEDLKNKKAFKEFFQGIEIRLEAESASYKHILSHQKIFAKFYHLKVTNFAQLKLEESKVINERDLSKYPISKLIENYLKKETNLLSLFST